MPFTPTLAHSNRLLDRLPSEDKWSFVADCEAVELASGQMLTEPGEKITHVHFPTDCLVSLFSTLENGSRLEVSMAGNEGMAGISLILGAERSSLQMLVQRAGPALRMSSACFRDHLGCSPALEQLMRRYLNVLISQISQSGACAHFHEVAPRLARRLLMTHDRTSGDQLHLTQDFLSSMLGVRRPGVSLAAKTLQRRGLITYERGCITVHDRPGLEQAACGCYATSRDLYEQMFEPVT